MYPRIRIISNYQIVPCVPHSHQSPMTRIYLLIERLQRLIVIDIFRCYFAFVITVGQLDKARRGHSTVRLIYRALVFKIVFLAVSDKIVLARIGLLFPVYKYSYSGWTAGCDTVYLSAHLSDSGSRQYRCIVFLFQRLALDGDSGILIVNEDHAFILGIGRTRV